ncbi:hypothetical protein AB4Y89_21680 [Terriglobus sp. 2YAB30_2]|uniref:glycoside hydrolase family protein n=1 Tax=unclassified Terriglobus TaxID=2628988 RepID=UPI003F9A7F66
MTAIELIEPVEGRIRWMYLDTEGLVTAGVGECLETADEACAFFGRNVTADYDHVAAMPKGMVASRYWYPGCPLLTDAQIDARRDKSIAIAEGDARKLVPPFSGLSPTRQAVLVDMSFNLGHKRLAGFTKTLALLAAGDFNAAADEMLDSAWAKEVPKRAKRDSDLMRAG